MKLFSSNIARTKYLGGGERGHGRFEVLITIVLLTLAVDLQWGSSRAFAAQTAGRPDGIDAETVFTSVGTRRPLPEKSIEALFTQTGCANRGACPGVWNDFCVGQGRTSITEEVGRCEAFDCVTLAIRAAQLEDECLTVPNLIVTLNKNRHFPPRPHDEVRGFTRLVSRTAQVRAIESATRAGRCRSDDSMPRRCLVRPGAAATSYDSYLASLQSAMARFPALAKSYFSALHSAAKLEVDSLSQKSQVLTATCRALVDSVRVESRRTPFSNSGCTTVNMPATSVEQVKLALQLKRQTEESHEREVAEGELEHANRIVSECSRKLQGLQTARSQSSGCRSALAEEQAIASYCADIRDLKMLNLEFERMRRVDAVSGTVELHGRRNIAEARLFLEDRAGRAKRTLAAAGKSPGDCKPEVLVRAKQTTSRACTVSGADEGLPECTSACWPEPCEKSVPGTLDEPERSDQPSPHLTSTTDGRSRVLQNLRPVAGMGLPPSSPALTKIRVSANGHVDLVRVLGVNRAIGDAIINDVQKWRFQPYLVDHKPAPFYFFDRIEPRRSSAIVACNSKGWAPFKAALRGFCAGNAKATACFANIGECNKQEAGRTLPIHIPADHDDFEYVLMADEGEAIVARFHWANGWVVTDVLSTGEDKGQEESNASAHSPPTKAPAFPSQMSDEDGR